MAHELLEHAAYLERLSRALVADEHTARDLVQETWSRALARPPRHGAHPRAWLAQVLRRTHWRWVRREPARATPEVPVDARDPGAALVEQELRLTIRRAVGELEPAEREALRMRFYEDLPPRAIAERLGLPVSTVNTRLQRALQRLRGRLDRRLGRRTWVEALLAPSLGGSDSAAAPRGAPSRRGAGQVRGARIPPRSLRLVAGGLALSGAALWLLATRPDRPEDGGPAGPRHAAASPRIVEAAPDRTAAAPESPAARHAVEVRDGAPPEAAASPDLPPLLVEVRDPLGRPVAGAEVSTFDLALASASLRPLGTTDGAGVLRLAVETRLLAAATEPFLGGRIGLLALAPAWTPSEICYVLPGRGELQLVLGPPGRTVRGRVRERDGRPVADARIEVGDYGGLTEGDGLYRGALPRFGSTGEDGGFVVEQVPAGARLLAVSAPGRATSRLYVPDEPRPLEVVLERGGRVAGRVSDEDGAPAHDAELWVLVPEDPREPVRVRSDASGAFVIDGLPPGDFHAFARGAGAPARRASRRVTSRPGAECVWHPRLAPAAGLSLELVSEGGAPLAGWYVNVASEDLLWLEGKVTDREGRLTVLDLPDEVLSVSVLGPRLEFERVVVPRLTLPGVVPIDSPLRIVVPDASRPSARLEGRLEGAAGLPPSGARIRIRRESEVGEGNVDVDVATGRFSTTRIPPGTWLLRAHLAELGSLDLGAVSLEVGQELDLGRLVLPLPGTLRLDWTPRPGDRVRITHRVQGRWHSTLVLDEPPDGPLPLLPGEVQVRLERGDELLVRTATVAAGSAARVDLESPGPSAE